MFIWLITIIFVVLEVRSKDNRDSCVWNGHDGNVYDLNVLKRSKNYQVPDTDTSLGMFNMVYEFNFCTWGVKCQQREVAAFEALEVMGKVTENCDTLGVRETQEIKFLNPSYPAQGISVTYAQGDMCFDVKEEEGIEKLMAQDQQMSMSPRSVSFEVSCSSSNDENFHVIDSSKCHIRLGINHNVGCPNGASSGSSGMFKTFLMFATVYLVGGYLYNTKKRGLSGVEAIPNIDKWRELPELIMTGVNKVLQTICGITRSYGQGSGSEGRGYATV